VSVVARMKARKLQVDIAERTDWSASRPHHQRSETRNRDGCR
jgi:hypothetical protein